MSNETPRKVRPFDLLQKYVPFAPPSRASDEDAAARFAICEGCPMLRTETKLKGRNRGLKDSCKSCNCYMPEKTKLAGAVCPLGKWSTVEAVS